MWCVALIARAMTTGKLPKYPQFIWDDDTLDMTQKAEKLKQVDIHADFRAVQPITGN